MNAKIMRRQKINCSNQKYFECFTRGNSSKVCVFNSENCLLECLIHKYIWIQMRCNYMLISENVYSGNQYTGILVLA